VASKELVTLQELETFSKKTEVPMLFHDDLKSEVLSDWLLSFTDDSDDTYQINWQTIHRLYSGGLDTDRRENTTSSVDLIWIRRSCSDSVEDGGLEHGRWHDAGASLDLELTRSSSNPSFALFTKTQNHFHSDVVGTCCCIALLFLSKPIRIPSSIFNVTTTTCCWWVWNKSWWYR